MIKIFCFNANYKVPQCRTFKVKNNFKNKLLLGTTNNNNNKNT